MGTAEILSIKNQSINQY